MIKKLFILLITCLISVPGAVKRVPSEYPKIQTAIDASIDGDTVLVSPGTYYENIIFRGKKIVVGSLFITTNDNSYINSTIINGSTPVYSDTASCVLFINGEDTSSVIAGFTLTGGKGTRWPDEHSSGVYYEGGGILSALSSPTIKNNIIIGNEAIRKSSSVSAGGGGIRCGDGAPRILNNIIIMNKGMYGGGIVLNYCAGAIIKNNIISQNQVYQAVSSTQTFGGGGLWINSQFPGNASLNVVENNNIIGNSSSGTTPAGWAGYGGGVYVTGAKLLFSNNIVWNNIQSKGKQFNLSSGSITVSYNNIQDGYTGTGNISVQPMFADSSFYLLDGSPMIDAGNPDASYNDPSDPNNPGNALFPSKGTVRSDIGVYGGKGRLNLSSASKGAPLFLTQSFDFGTVLRGNSTLIVFYYNSGGTKLSLDSIKFRLNLDNELKATGNFPRDIQAGGKDSITINWNPILNRTLADTALVYFHGTLNPFILPIKGVSQITGINDPKGKLTYSLEQNYPNPFNPSTSINYSLAEGSNIKLKIYNVTGEEVITLVDKYQSPGVYNVVWNSKNSSGNIMPSGIYFYRLESGNFTDIKKMILLR